MSAAERAKRYRNRQQQGIVVVPVEVTWVDVDAFDVSGFARWSQSDDRSILARAVRKRFSL
jgi:hypothetical protein